MDAPKKFPVQDFLDAITRMRRAFGVQSLVPASTVLHRSMVIFERPGSYAATLAEVASSIALHTSFHLMMRE